ncbi:hypothetical protein B484DRAFT_448753 [Ochromonadaceae sp. CCMP2298]|nr:hypothetical protein B484DRAFT_448753 [Ochromonadaceae sp. CCMP2298]
MKLVQFEEYILYRVASYVDTHDLYSLLLCCKLFLERFDCVHVWRERTKEGSYSTRGRKKNKVTGASVKKSYINWWRASIAHKRTQAEIQFERDYTTAFNRDLLRATAAAISAATRGGLLAATPVQVRCAHTEVVFCYTKRIYSTRGRAKLHTVCGCGVQCSGEAYLCLGCDAHMCSECSPRGPRGDREYSNASSSLSVNRLNTLISACTSTSSRRSSSLSTSVRRGHSDHSRGHSTNTQNGHCDSVHIDSVHSDNDHGHSHRHAGHPLALLRPPERGAAFHNVYAAGCFGCGISAHVEAKSATQGGGGGGGAGVGIIQRRGGLLSPHSPHHNSNSTHNPNSTTSHSPQSPHSPHSPLVHVTFVCAGVDGLFRQKLRSAEGRGEIVGRLRGREDFVLGKPEGAGLGEVGTGGGAGVKGPVVGIGGGD